MGSCQSKQTTATKLNDTDFNDKKQARLSFCKWERGAWTRAPITSHQKNRFLYSNNRGTMSKAGNPPGKGMVCKATKLGMGSFKGVVVGNGLGY